MVRAMEVEATERQTGHLQLAKIEIWNGDLPKHKEDAYIENYEAIENRLQLLPEVHLSSGRADAYVLLSNGDRSIGAQAIGFDSQIAKRIEKNLTFEEGTGFSGQNQFEILVGAGLQKQLQLKIGQTVSVVSQTLSGSISSVDLEVRGIVRSVMTEVNNTTVYVPLGALQKLLGIKRVERISIILKDGVSLSTGTEVVRRSIQDLPELVLKDWKQTATFYHQITKYYDTQNFLIVLILSTLVFFGILNTIGMSVFERVGEIGTMRALGDQRGEVLTLLLLEAFLLGLAGALIGIPISWLLSSGISSLEIPLLLPGASQPIPVSIIPGWLDYIHATVTVSITCLISSLWPAQKAVRLSIVDALRTNS